MDPLNDQVIDMNAVEAIIEILGVPWLYVTKPREFMAVEIIRNLNKQGFEVVKREKKHASTS